MIRGCALECCDVCGIGCDISLQRIDLGRLLSHSRLEIIDALLSSRGQGLESVPPDDCHRSVHFDEDLALIGRRGLRALDDSQRCGCGLVDVEACELYPCCS